ncbi:EGF-like domain protein [Ancylostoma ceylanicum]|uniref:EGF-like domain protein n=1 Tax=Ancylostoma ceylanicum TaxID=53326 RepID=A0A0D6LTJ4_9BILA|nr:EGF-like domain protein [Ancylostoma ceylanicum]
MCESLGYLLDQSVKSICSFSDLNYCSTHSDLCRNGGICLADSFNSYRCNCSAEYEGRNCERRKKKDDCSMIDCGVGVCVMASTPQCECPTGFAGAQCEYSSEGHLKPPFRFDTLLISFALLVLAICLAVISVSVRFICEKLDLIQRGGQAGPLYSTHWVAAEVHESDRDLRLLPQRMTLAKVVLLANLGGGPAQTSSRRPLSSRHQFC